MEDQIINLSIFLDYLYNKFLVTLLLCIIGTVIKELLTNSFKKDHKSIPISRIICSSILGTIIICALISYIHLSFSIYVLLCVLTGIWGENIINIIIDDKFLGIVLKNTIGIILKNKELGDAIAKAADEIEQEEDKREKELKENNDKK